LITERQITSFTDSKTIRHSSVITYTIGGKQIETQDPVIICNTCEIKIPQQ